MRRSKNGIPTVAIILGFTFALAAHVKAGGIQITPLTNAVRAMERLNNG